MMTDKLGYQQVAAATVVIKPTPAGLFSVTCIVAGAVTVYDSAAAASGNILYTKTMAVGEIATWASHGISANNGLVVVAAGTVNVAYT
jgi:hypothetical protein